MTTTEIKLPQDFLPLTVVLPESARENMFGYKGSARFVGFYWSAAAKGVVWTDGKQQSSVAGENFTFLRFLRPLSYLYNVNFGSRGGEASHLLIWDLEEDTTYMVPRASGLAFLREQWPTAVADA